MCVENVCTCTFPDFMQMLSTGQHFGAQKYIEHQSTQKSCTALKSNARGTSQHGKAAIAIRKKSELDFVHTPAAAEKKIVRLV